MTKLYSVSPQPSACPEYVLPSLMYKVYFTGYGLINVNQAESCSFMSCSIIFTDLEYFTPNSSKYDLLIVATNYSHILKQFNLTIGESIYLFFFYCS